MDYPIEYVPDEDFAAYVNSQKAKEMVAIDGRNRWIITKDDDTKVMVRPESAK